MVSVGPMPSEYLEKRMVRAFVRIWRSRAAEKCLYPGESGTTAVMRFPPAWRIEIMMSRASRQMIGQP